MRVVKGMVILWVRQGRGAGSIHRIEIEPQSALICFTQIEAFDGHRWDSPPKFKFAPDSPLEEDGFELLVPFTQKSHAVWGGESPKLEAIAEHLPPKILAV